VRTVLTGASALIVAGALLLTTLHSNGSWLALALPLLPFGAGVGLAFGVMDNAAVSTVPVENAGIDGYSRLAYTEALPDEKAATAIGFMHRARVFFAAHGIVHIQRIVTDNGACYRAKDFAKVLHGARHQRITPAPLGTTARWSVTTASWPRSSSMPGAGHPNNSEPTRWACGTSTTTTTARTPPRGIGLQCPSSVQA
jgi:hypothetical protein